MNHPIYEKAKRGEWIDHSDRAKLVRTALKAKWPKVKFSVTSQTYSGGGTVRVRWFDGPTGKQVERIAGQFETKGFDGSIDLAHSRDLWLAPDGSASIAHDSGTQGSGGQHSEVIGSAHHPDAVLVSHICSGFVSCNRSLSVEMLQRCIDAVKAMNWGVLADFPWHEIVIKTWNDGAAHLTGPAGHFQMPSGQWLDGYICLKASEFELQEAKA